MSQKKDKVYISGPITGDQYAKTKFERAELRLGKKYAVINPFKIPGVGTLEMMGAPWEKFMRLDLAELTKADAIYMLRGWWHSRGARLERRLAKALKIRIMYESRAEAMAYLRGEE